MKTISTLLRDLINSNIIGTETIAVDGMNKWTPPRKAGGIPLVSLGVENEHY